MSTFWPRFTFRRPALCPAKVQGPGIPLVKLRQDPLAQPSQKTVKRIEFTDLQSLRCPFRDLGIFFFTMYSVVDVGEAAVFNHPRRQLFWRSQIARMSRICVTVPHPHCRFRLSLRPRMSADICLAISALRLRVRVLFEIECGCHVCDGMRPSLSRLAVSREVERLVLLHSAFDGRCSNHHRRNFAS